MGGESRSFREYVAKKESEATPERLNEMLQTKEIMRLVTIFYYNNPELMVEDPS